MLKDHHKELCMPFAMILLHLIMTHQGVERVSKAYLGHAPYATEGRSVQQERPVREGILLSQRVHRQQGDFGRAQHARGESSSAVWVLRIFCRTVDVDGIPDVG